MARRGHKGHPDCEFTSKAACDKAIRVAIGQCSSMISEEKQCPNWGVDRVEDRAYCGQHIRTVYLAADNARRDAIRRDAMNSRIDRSLAWHREHPSVWDLMPAEPAISP
jgi:hypothetical protein